MRCAPNHTLLYIDANDKDDAQYEELKMMEDQLRELRTLDGKPYRLLRLPMPEAIYDAGERLPATYANFVIINGKPSSFQPTTSLRTTARPWTSSARHSPTVRLSVSTRAPLSVSTEVSTVSPCTSRRAFSSLTTAISSKVGHLKKKENEDWYNSTA